MSCVIIAHLFVEGKEADEINAAVQEFDGLRR